MKKLLFLLLFFALTASITAQSHMQFMGFPIDGTPNLVEDRLLELDFTKINTYKFKGYFNNMPAVINTNKEFTNGRINKISVVISQTDMECSRAEMYDIYKQLFRDYKKKYQTAKIKSGSNKFTIETKLGYIYVFINDMSKAFGGTLIMIDYKDKANSSSYSVPYIEDARNDL